jgi:fructokinase
VARSSTSKETLFGLLEKARYKVFDVNLRPPHYTHERIIGLMKAADFVKFNDDELYEICSHLKFNDKALEACIRFMAEQTETSQICVTLGKDGAVLFYNNEFYYNKGYRIVVADTVGAGDSFLASIISQLLNGSHPQEAIDFACAVGAIVASKKGANPDVSTLEVRSMMES